MYLTHRYERGINFLTSLVARKEKSVFPKMSNYPFNIYTFVSQAFSAVSKDSEILLDASNKQNTAPCSMLFGTCGRSLSFQEVQLDFS